MRAVTHAAPVARASTTAPPASMVQCKLTVGAPDDGFEREADRIADAVVGASPLGGLSIRPTRLGVQRSCGECKKENEAKETIQRKCSACAKEDELAQRQARGPGGGATSPHAQQHIDQLRSEGGTALPTATRSFMQDRFGFDFSHVRVHAGSVAAKAASGLGARAFTVGRDIVFNDGEYAPEQATGQRLLAHELTHVLQQGAAHGQLIQRECRYDKGPQPKPVLYLDRPDASVAEVKQKMTAYFAGRSADSNGIIALTAKKERDPLFKSYFPLPPGNKYDARTQTAVQVFQTEQKLPMDSGSYGVVERCTWEALDKLPGGAADAQKKKPPQPAAVEQQPAAPPPKPKEPVDLRTPAQLLVEDINAEVKAMQAAGRSVADAKLYVSRSLMGGLPVAAGAGGGLGTTGLEPQKAKEGKMCHKVISKYYADVNPGTIVGDETIGALNDWRILKLLLKAGVVLTNEQFAELPEDLAALLTKRPDILDAPKLQVYEIKPFPQVALAQAEALWYINILKRFARRAGVEEMENLKRGSPNNSGANGWFPAPDGFCIWACPLPGAIVYQVVRPPDNPQHEAERLRWRAEGISDLSMGVESFVAIGAVGLGALEAVASFPALLAYLAQLLPSAGGAAAGATAGGGGILIPALAP